MFQYERPPARPRIAAARAVGEIVGLRKMRLVLVLLRVIYKAATVGRAVIVM